MTTNKGQHKMKIKEQDIKRTHSIKAENISFRI